MKAAIALVAALPAVLAGVAKSVEDAKRDSVAEAVDAIFRDKRSSTGEDRDDPVQGLPECAPENDKKYQPVLDFDRDGCYNVAAIDADGNLDKGLWNCYTAGQSHCRDESDLDSQNVYSRARCNNGWCAYMYDYYFEKDVALQHVCGVGAGHRYDWEHIVVFVQGGEVKYVAASAHGDFDTRAVSDVRMDGTHPKIVYHKDGASTHAFRFGREADEDIENHKGQWWRGALLSHYGWPNGQLRDKMYHNDWNKANIALKDSSFPGTLDKAKKGKDISLDTSYDDENSPGQPECSK